MPAGKIPAIAIASAMVSMALAGPGLADERIALVIGNADYTGMDDLNNPENDARAMADKLQEVGFSLVGDKPHLNVTYREMLRLLRTLHRTLVGSEGATSLVYFSGHGVSEGGDNWVIPVDAQDIQFREDVRDLAIGAREGIMSRLEDRGGGQNIVILDACRDSALQSWRPTKSSRIKGLARIEPLNPARTVIFYAASEGQYAYDGGGDLSPFTSAFLKEMDEPNKRLVDVFGDAAHAVQEATKNNLHGAQIPDMAGRPPRPAFKFRPGAAIAEPLNPAEEPQGLQVALPVEIDRGADAAADRTAARDLVVQQARPGEEIQDCPTCPRLVVVPPGVFEMGSPADIGADDETARHRVVIPEPIAVGMHEVKRSEFQKFLDETDRLAGDACWQYDGVARREGRGTVDPGFAQGENEPILCVSWKDAQAYVDWLSQETSRTYRLLSEAEWEYAARGGTATGRDRDDAGSGACENANGADRALRSRYDEWFALTAACDDGHAHTSEVGRYGANGFGLHDMLGNAREWVEDCWHPDYEGAPADGSAWTEGGDCRLRVLRGGSWLDGPGGVRFSNRDKSTTGIRFSANGFRVARTL